MQYDPGLIASTPACRAAIASRTCHSEPGGEVCCFQFIDCLIEHSFLITLHTVFGVLVPLVASLYGVYLSNS